MTLSDWNNFKGAAKRLEDMDIPRIASKIGVGEDELHAFMDVETAGGGFDAQGRPKMLFEPHVFYRNLTGAKRDAAVKAGLAYPKWGQRVYPKDSYPRLVKAMAIDETAALKSASWGLGQVLGENHEMAGYKTVQDMVRTFMTDEEWHLSAMVDYLISAKLADDLRRHDWTAVARGYNGPGYAKNAYHTKMAAAFKKWSKIKDTAWSPGGKTDAVVAAPITVPVPTPKPTVVDQTDVIRQVQDLLWDKGYPEVGESDGKFGKRTRNAILAFQADNDLPLTGQVTDDLLAQLIKAPKREMAPARENATEKDLKAEPVVSDANWLKKLGAAILTASGVGGVLDGTGNLDNAIGGIGKLKSLAETVLSISPWILVGAAGFGVFYFGRRVVKKYVEAYREGRAL
ncbi:putative endolysin protein [Rhizobium phage RHph_X2_30]|nr:putative endolysin protein [Rhizobium phage RHph_X2_30]